MSIKKSLLALAVLALAMMGFASSAMAGTGKLVHHEGTTPIPEGREMHSVGWAKFATGTGTFTCHTTSVTKATGTTGTTGQVTAFTVPDTTKCTGTGFANGCKLKSHQSTNLPYSSTVTNTGRVDITGSIVLDNVYEGCVLKKATLTFSSIELTPLKTGSRVVTGTENRLGETANLKETIAGFEIDSASGTVEREDIFGGKSTEAVTGSGEFELTSPDRCTWEIVEV
jgi:hypothetical protein